MNVEKLTEQEQQDLLNRVFGTKDGEIALELIKLLVGWDRMSFNKDPYQTAFNDGKKEVIRGLLRIMTINLTKGKS